MIDGELFDKLDGIARVIRKKPHLPFGGLQLVLCGDFHQLPPVSKKDDNNVKRFAFTSQAWHEIFTRDNMACLKQVFRQQDMELVRILGEMRKGRIMLKDETFIQSLSRKLVYPDGIPPVEL